MSATRKMLKVGGGGGWGGGTHYTTCKKNVDMWYNTTVKNFEQTGVSLIIVELSMKKLCCAIFLID